VPFVLLLFCSALAAQDAPPQPPEPVPDTSTAGSFWNRFWISGQANFIRQQHGDFYAAYSGPNSLHPYAEHATSRVLTLYTGFQITKNLEILADVEEAGGGGLSNALGLAGFTDLDVVRNPSLSKAPYMAREMLHYILPLSDESGEATRNPLSLASTLPVRRLEFRLGKMSTVDFFDVNSIGSDSHLQFMNWTVDNNGAYDYAADTRGYTYGLLIEYYDRSWVFRFGEFLMPTVANGITLDWDIARARADNWELELHRGVFPHRTSVLRLLSFVNHANMGLYEEANTEYLEGLTPTPSIVDTRVQGRVKYGFGVNVEQPLTDQWRAFGRLGWNNGSTESFAYTEADRTASIGSDLYGKLWHRPQDKVGAAFVANGISGAHAEYLALGGLGFILGDGGLTYGLEKIFETYYTAHIWRGVSFAADWQHIVNPGYNEVRGPVSVFSLRLHIEDAIPFDKFGAH
jgi:high affinity Mn2+ porin